MFEMEPIETVRRFSHVDVSENDETKCRQISDMGNRFADIINGLCPDGREQSIAITKLEEVVMWANKAISHRSANATGK